MLRQLCCRDMCKIFKQLCVIIWIKTERRFYQITVVIEQLFVNLGAAHDQTRIDVNLRIDV